MRNLKTEIINTTKQIGDLVDWLVLRHASPELYEPTMYIDLEGVDLCREGSISILTLLIDTGIPTIRVCLIDVHLLGSQAFNTHGIKEKTLKDILQDGKIPKVFFDVRNDSDALFTHFGVALQGVEDVQLMESATRTTTSSRRLLNGLVKCVEQDLLHGSELAGWKLAKEKGARLFKAEYGGSYKVFEQRPIPNEIVSYCVGDVQHLPKLWSKFRWKTIRWRDLVNEETKKRVEASQKPEYEPHGRDRALAPWSKDQNKTLDEWNYVPPRRDYFNEDCDWDFEEDYDWYDEGPTSCRDIINDEDYYLYYSD
jgi:exonuclease 3'-5' domain-containing protein 1